MKISIEKFNNSFKAFCIVILFNNYYCISKTIYQTSFTDVDSLQHTHIAWNISQGLKLYKDFFEHHGPLYSLLNGFILSKIENPASINTLYFLREISFISSIICVLLIFLIAKNIYKSTNLALLSITIYSTWSIVQKVFIQIRPDIMQNLFMLMAVYLLLKAKDTKFNILFLLSGFSYGLMILFNLKSIIVIFALVFSLIYCKTFKDSLKKEILFLLIGFVIPLTCTSIYFFQQNAFNEFIYSNFVTNMNIFINKSTIRPYQFFAEAFILKDYLQTILLIISLYFINRNNFKQNIILSSFLFSLYGTIKGLHNHYTLIYLPYASIFISNFFFRSYFYCKEKKQQTIFVISSFLITLHLFNNNQIIHYADLKKESRLTHHENLLNWTIANIDRQEPIGIVSNRCISYIFNKDLAPKIWFVHSKAKLKLSKMMIEQNIKKLKAINTTPSRNPFSQNNFSNLILNGTKTCLLINNDFYKQNDENQQNKMLPKKIPQVKP